MIYIYGKNRPYLKAITVEKNTNEPQRYYMLIEDTLGIDSREMDKNWKEVEKKRVKNGKVIAWQSMHNLPFEQERPITGFIFCFDLNDRSSWDVNISFYT